MYPIPKEKICIHLNRSGQGLEMYQSRLMAALAATFAIDMVLLALFSILAWAMV